MAGNYSGLRKRNGTIRKKKYEKTLHVELNYVEFFRGSIKNDMKKRKKRME